MLILLGLPLAYGCRLPSSKSSYSLIDFFDRYSLNYLPVCRTCLQLPMEVRYGNGPQNNINIQTMLMNLNLVLIILMIKNSLSVYGFYERRLNMRGTRFSKLTEGT